MAFMDFASALLSSFHPLPRQIFIEVKAGVLRRIDILVNRFVAYEAAPMILFNRPAIISETSRGATLYGHTRIFPQSSGVSPMSFPFALVG